MSDRNILDAFRRWGYLQADLDWLGRLEPADHPELPQEGDGIGPARAVYCGTIGVEFMHIPDPERRAWIAERMEAERTPSDQERLLDLLVRATSIEQTLQSKYIGNKRFSIEGIEALIPLLDQILDAAASWPARAAVLAMSHRGRLNVMAQIVGVPQPHIFAGFEDVDPRSILGAGDVKYHMGATGEFTAAGGSKLHIHLVSNPSHLEAVDPVAAGRTLAKQVRLGDARGEMVFPIVMHGDAAFAGQGITAETLNLAEVPGFDVGGTIHVIVNNLIGFTAEPEALHSTRYASDLGKRSPIPVFHVNGDDVDAVAHVGRMALDYRFTFSSDVVVDLIGHRKHGHSEVDDPTITQPTLYQQIGKREPLWRMYAEASGSDLEAAEAAEARIKDELHEAKEAATQLRQIPTLRTMPGYWSDFTGGPHKPEYEVDTGMPREKLTALGTELAASPEGFHIHPKVAKLLESRREMAAGERPLDFGMAEALAFASLLDAGVPVRLTGQDSRRGTFNHRHSCLVDTETEDLYFPLQHVSAEQARFDIHDSVLSEAAVLGFEYGYSRDSPETLVLWEAQFGDFVNGAQVILDQFVTAGEDKWGLLSGLVLLLPHGFEGQGPEHSSARIERFLQLAAEDAIQVAQPTSAGQYFHLLRRQALRKWRKPLIVFTPKSLLRHPWAASDLAALTEPRFLEVVPDRGSENAERILLCTGKIAQELEAERERREDTRTAIVKLDQLYPFPEKQLRQELERHAAARHLLWVQEEPANMGALDFIRPRITRLAANRHLRSIKRSASASPATGSAKAHKVEQETLVRLAFS